MIFNKHLVCIIYDYLAMDANIDGSIETSEYWLSKQTFCVKYNEEQQCAYYFMNGLRHNCNDQPAIEHYAESKIKHRCWMHADYFHRNVDDGPALDSVNAKIWYVDGYIHRDNDKPAIIELTYDKTLIQIWYHHGKRHRFNDQPAYSHKNTHIWYQHGKIHRDNDKPALIIVDAEHKAWFNNGIRHRKNGPALIPGRYRRRRPRPQYWLDGMKCSEIDVCDIFACNWFD